MTLAVAAVNNWSSLLDEVVQAPTLDKDIFNPQQRALEGLLDLRFAFEG